MTYAERQAARKARQLALDEQYRQQVTGRPDSPLPKVIGRQSSAGAARGGQGASKIGKGRHS